jgi:hypothetical protein
MFALFSQFGKILDVVALKTFRLRGQAWIVFTDVAAATNALRTMQGFAFFDKPIVGAACFLWRHCFSANLVFLPSKSDVVCLGISG